MRIAPVMLPYLVAPSASMWRDTVIATAITHRDSAAVATSVAWIALLWDLLGMDAVPDPSWWGTRFSEVARQVESPARTYHPRGGEWLDFEGRFSAWIDRCCNVFASEPDVRTAGRLWYSGAFLLETVPSVLHVLSRHSSDPEEAIVCAVNNTRDNDTVAAIVGAALGALHGAEAFPARWRDGLLGRLGSSDDGRVMELIDAAVERFAPQ